MNDQFLHLGIHIQSRPYLQSNQAAKNNHQLNLHFQLFVSDLNLKIRV